MSAQLHPWDWTVIALYAAGALGVGSFYSRRNRTADDQLVGGRDRSPWMVGLSFFAAVFSTLTYLARPGEMIRHGPWTLAGLAAAPLCYWIVGWHLIPVFMRLRVTSANELLELRLGLAVRQTAVGFFLVMRLCWMALILHATVAVVIVPMIGARPEDGWWIGLAAAAITIAYTTLGGLKAVIAVDAVQALLLFAGVLFTLLLISRQLGDPTAWWPHSWDDQWSGARWFAEDAGSQRPILALFAGTLFWYVCTAGSDQMAIQRYAATRDVRAARRMFGVALTAGCAIHLLLCGLGVALHAYAVAHPEIVPPGRDLAESADDLFPRFILTVLPAGLCGLIIAGLLGEALNSFSSGLSATAAVVVTDVMNRFRAARNAPAGELRLIRITSALLGVVVVLLSSGLTVVSGNLFELSQKVVNLLVAPLFGLFFMAIFVRFATACGTLVGAACGVLAAAAVNYWPELTGRPSPISFLWGMPVSLGVQIAAGCLASLACGPRPQGKAPAVAGST